MLTEKEKTLLSYLQKNARESLTTISKKTDIPISTLFETLKRLTRTTITKHTSILNYDKLGYPLKVHFEIKTKNKQDTKAFLEQNKHVNSAYSTLNGPNIYAECIFSQLKELIEFKEQLEKLDVELKETFIVDELIREAFKL